MNAALTKNTLRYFIIFLFVTFLFPVLGFAQKMDWSTTAKIKDNNNIYDIGSSGDEHFALLSEYSIKRDFLARQIYYSDFKWDKKNEIQIAKFNKQFGFVATYPIQFKYKILAFYFGFTTGNQIQLIYSTVQDKKCAVYADVFDLNGTYQNSKLLHASAPLNIKKDEEVGPGYFTVIRSEFDNTFIIDQGKFVLFFNKELEKIWETEAASESIMTAQFTPDGQLWTVVTDKKSAFLKQSNYVTKTLQKSVIDFKKETLVDEFMLKVSPEQKAVYLACVTGNKNDKSNWTLGPRRYIASFSNGVLFNKYDVQSLKELDSKKVLYNDEVLSAIAEEKNVSKIKGLEWMSIVGLHISSIGDPIAVLQKDFYEETQVKDQYGKVIESRYNYVYEDVVILKATQAGDANQVALKRKTKGAALYDYMLSMVSFYADNKLTVFFNEGKTGYKLNQYQFDGDLNQLNKLEIPTYKEHGVYLDLKHMVTLSTKSFLLWGREGKNVATLKLTF